MDKCKQRINKYRSHLEEMEKGVDKGEETTERHQETENGETDRDRQMEIGRVQRNKEADKK